MDLALGRILRTFAGHYCVVIVVRSVAVLLRRSCRGSLSQFFVVVHVVVLSSFNDTSVFSGFSPLFVDFSSSFMS